MTRAAAATRYVGYIAMSLDGYIATPGGEVGWLSRYDEVLREALDFDSFLAGIDALLLGRRSYEQAAGWGWPYGERPGYVLTRQADYCGAHVAAAGSLDSLCTAISRDGHGTVWVMGGGEAQRAALDRGLMSRLRLFVMPELLGGGTPCFPGGGRIAMDLVASRALPGGVLQLDYAPRRDKEQDA